MSEQRIKDLTQAVEAVEEHGTITKAAKALGIPRKTLSDRYKSAERELEEYSKEKVEDVEKGSTRGVTYMGTKIETPEQLLEECEIDLLEWEIERVVCNHWEVAAKDPNGDGFIKTPLRQIKVTLKKKSDKVRAIESLIEDIRQNRNLDIKTRKYSKNRKGRYALEISICDPHLGMHCYLPDQNQRWDLDLCENYYLYAVDELIRQAHEAVGEFEKIYWVFGNDFHHVDNVQHMTTKGTPQPEEMDHFETIKRGKILAINAAERMLEHAPVESFQIPGNHDKLTSYMQGMVLDAYFHKHSDFQIDCSSGTYKRFRYGASLVAMEHGHSVNAIRLAALMANMWSKDYAETHYHCWHLGDQHRKGTSKPSAFEEQGVSIDYLPGLTAVNRWHAEHSYSFQKRGATAFIWDYDCGKTHELTCNISKYTGQWLGTGYDDWLKENKVADRA